MAVDGNDHIISSSGHNQINEQEALIATHENRFNNISQNESGYFFTKIADENSMVVYDEIDINDWKLMYIISYDEIYQPIAQLKDSITFLFIIALIAAVIISIAISSSITKNLTNLRSVMLTQGDDNNTPIAYVGKISNDEIGDLAKVYNQMAHTVNDLFQRITEEQRKKREMELNFLHMEINSHFLYNTLNSVKILAQMNKTEEISELITALIQLLRAISSKNELIRIKDELFNITNYAFIQRIRYWDKFTISYDVADDIAENYLIPNLLLQPIVENSIVHGIVNVDKTVHIHLSAVRDGDDIIISIVDDGAGIPQEQLPYIKKNYSKMNSVGLRNVEERIELFYGEGYGIDVQSTLGQGTEVKIKIKAQTNPN